jgi:hypothetical protein
LKGSAIPTTGIHRTRHSQNKAVIVDSSEDTGENKGTEDEEDTQTTTARTKVENKGKMQTQQGKQLG